jgi:NADH dehydrogenase FAD-containing subunit
MLSLGRNLREYAESKFKRDGVKVKGNSKITAVGPDWLELEGEGRGKSGCRP